MIILLILGILGIIGFIALIIALVYYFMMSKKEGLKEGLKDGLKDGKYVNKDEKRAYWTISNNRVQFWVDEYEGNFRKFFDVDIIKSDMKVSIDGKERVAYVSTTSLDGRSGSKERIYIAQSDSDVLFFYVVNYNGVLQEAKDKEFSNFKKVD